MNELHQMKEDYIREILRIYREKGLIKETIEVIDALVHTAKNLCKLIEADSYSERMSPHSYAAVYDMNSGNYSYARGRGANANRDSMGRYSSLGYSGHDDMVAGLRDLMNNTHDEATRRELADMINRYQ